MARYELADIKRSRKAHVQVNWCFNLEANKIIEWITMKTSKERESVESIGVHENAQWKPNGEFVRQPVTMRASAG